MFNNANVLFKTKFVDGLSTVSRIVQNRPMARVDTNVAVGDTTANKKPKKKARNE